VIGAGSEEAEEAGVPVAPGKLVVGAGSEEAEVEEAGVPVGMRGARSSSSLEYGAGMRMPRTGGDADAANRREQLVEERGGEGLVDTAASHQRHTPALSVGC
jgi:hypothetical protein